MKSTLCAGIKLLSLAFVVCLTKTSIAKPQEVKLTDVGHCQYLADVKGHSGWQKLQLEGFGKAGRDRRTK